MSMGCQGSLYEVTVLALANMQCILASAYDLTAHRTRFTTPRGI